MSGAQTVPPAEWDARAELDIGRMIGRYLAQRPAPVDSAVAADLSTWATRLEEDGTDRLAVLGARPLTLVPDAAGPEEQLGTIDGEAIFREIREVLDRRLPELAEDDPSRPHLSQILEILTGPCAQRLGVAPCA